MKLVVVLEIEAYEDGDAPDPTLVDPENVAGEVVREGEWCEMGGDLFRVKVARAEWADNALREGLQDLVGDEEEQ